MQDTEFSAYESDASGVEQLVDHDTGAKEFFEYHNSPALPVIYIPHLHLPRGRTEIVAKLQEANAAPKNPLIIATTIALQNMDGGEKPIRHRKSTHSILLLWDGTTVYLYDPNGNYNIEYQSWVYKIYRGPGQQSVEFPRTTEAAAQQLAHLLHIPRAHFVVPTTVGIQVLNQTIADSPYIGRGGYCMFYNWLAINFVKTFQQSERGWMAMAYNQLCSAAAVVAAGGRCNSKVGSLCTSWGPFLPATGVFPAPPNTLEGQTVRIIKLVWPNATAPMDTSEGGGNMARRRLKYRSKRRNSRRRRRSKKKTRKRFTCKRKKLRRKKRKKRKKLKTRRNKRTKRTR